MLVVDLDGTLLKSDMLHESFWSALSCNWRSPFRATRALRQGKAALKGYLRSEANIDVSTLPYDDAVLAYIRAYRKTGGRVALVTATNQALAEKIADHLQIFDEVHGSDDRINLKGPAKADFLVKRFGQGAFTYMGDTPADLPVWRAARKIITLNAPASLRHQTDAMGKTVEHLTTKTRSARPYFMALRPHQWSKNTLIFLPMLAAHQFDMATLLKSVLAFIAFSLVASSVYILNDLLDLDADRAHPRKRTRPFASGDVPIADGSLMAFACLLAGALVAALLGGAFILTLAVYYMLTAAYSLALKRRIVLDISVLAGLYTMRIIAGSVATGIALSEWLLAFSIFFFLSLAAAKRQAELVDMVARGLPRTKGRGYHVRNLPIISVTGLVSGYLSVLVMALYVTSTAVKQLYSAPYALWGICGVLFFWLTRTALITRRGAMHDDPVVFAITDRTSQICFVVILGFATLGVVL